MSTGILAKRVANVLIARGLDPRAAGQGDLWMGGKVTLTGDRLAFHPNGLNRAVHVGSLDVELALPDVESVEVLPGFPMKIIAITTSRQMLKIRCYRAQAFADQIRDLAFGSAAATG